MREFISCGNIYDVKVEALSNQDLHNWLLHLYEFSIVGVILMNADLKQIQEMDPEILTKTYGIPIYCQADETLPRSHINTGFINLLYMETIFNCFYHRIRKWNRPLHWKSFQVFVRQKYIHNIMHSIRRYLQQEKSRKSPNNKRKRDEHDDVNVNINNQDMLELRDKNYIHFISKEDNAENIFQVFYMINVDIEQLKKQRILIKSKCELEKVMNEL